ncbi:MAG: Uma2 family endonuclease [Akkermansiaceae bacterium]|nr:Uma2 family endonuclease [Armatimonadota bacterium]
MEAVAEKVAPGAFVQNGTDSHAKLPPTREELIEALYGEEGKAEIINGRIVRFAITGDEPSRAAKSIVVALTLWERATRPPGRSYTDGVAYLANLPHRQSFSPDVSYYTGPPAGMKFLPEPPVFAVEVRSEGDYGPAAEREMQAKRDDYFATVTEVVWDVDLLGTESVIRKFTKSVGSQNPVAAFRRGEMAEAEPVTPGFVMPVDDLLE